MAKRSDFKILITGAGGMLGTDLAKALDQSFDVVGLDRRPAPHLSVPLEICDLTQARRTQDCIVGYKPGLVIHCAAMTDVDYCEDHHDEALEQNVEATKNVVAACNEADVPLIFFSTDYVFNGQKKGPYVEMDTPDPVSFYGTSKKLAEDFILQNAKRAVIFRISWLFGVHGRSFPRSILRQAVEVKKLTVVSDQTGNPTYSKDVAEALGQLLQAKKSVFSDGVKEIYHLANSGTTHWADLARFILAEAGLKDVTVEDISSNTLKRPAPRPTNSVLSVAKVKKELGISMRSWQEAIRDFLENLNEEPGKVIHVEPVKNEPPEEN